MGIERGYNSPRRKCGRVVDCTGLENRRLERVREFESHRFRQVNRHFKGLSRSNNLVSKIFTKAIQRDGFFNP